MKKWKNNSEKEEKGIWILLGIMAILIIAWFIFIVPSPVPTIVEPPVLEEPTEEIVPPAKEEPPTLVESPVIEAPETPLTPVESPVVEVPPLEEPAVEDPPVKEEPTAPVKEPVVEVPPVEEPPAPPVPEIPSNFIVPDEVWENAFLLNRVDGTPYKGFIGFSDIPIGTKLYAPMDGYIHYLRTLNEKNEVVDSVAILTQSADWSANLETKTREVYFLAREIKVINTEPKKGEAFATILNNSEMSPDQYGWYNRKTLLTVFVDEAWSKLSDRNIEDPLTYFWSVIQAIISVK